MPFSGMRTHGALQAHSKHETQNIARHCRAGAGAHAVDAVCDAHRVAGSNGDAKPCVSNIGRPAARPARRTPAPHNAHHAHSVHVTHPHALAGRHRSPNQGRTLAPTSLRAACPRCSSSTPPPHSSLVTTPAARSLPSGAANTHAAPLPSSSSTNSDHASPAGVSMALIGAPTRAQEL